MAFRSGQQGKREGRIVYKLLKAHFTGKVKPKAIPNFREVGKCNPPMYEKYWYANLISNT